MNVYKDSNRSSFLLLSGLLILVASILLSLLSINHLEESVKARRVSFDAQDSFDEVRKSIKDWEILVYKNNVPDKRKLLLEKENEVNKNFTIVDDRIAGIQPEVERLHEIKDAWEHLRKNYLNPSDRDYNLINSDFEKMDLFEKNKVKFHEPIILQSTNHTYSLIVFAVIIALILIVLSIYSRILSNRKNITYIEELKLLQMNSESASAIKTKFLSTISHEIRTPLNGIIGLSDILLRTSQSISDRKYITAIHQSGKTLLRIINDILDFSKIESGRIHLENEDFSVLEVLDQVLFTLSPKASEKLITLNYETDPDIPISVFGDAARLSQVLFNLVGNAIKFTSDGYVKVKVKATRANGNLKLQFLVEDSGCGIPKEDLNKLFTPFSQIRKVGTSGEPGTGLGLSISRRIIQIMGGEIHVSSEIHHGSKFWFDIPFTKFSDHVVGPRSTFLNSKEVKSEVQLSPLFTDSKTPNVLIVEDNPTNQIVAQAMLSQLGVNSVLGSNGMEGVEIASRSTFDLILMDLQMPTMDGYEATRELRKLGVQTPILAMTANCTKEDEEKCIATGMNGFISKPMMIDALRETLKKHLSGYILFSMATLDVLDKKIGVKATGKVVQSFLSTLPELENNLPELIKNNQVEEINRLGHKFKSSALTVGDNELAKFCEEIQNANNIIQVQKLIGKLPEIITSTRLHMNNYLSKNHL